MSTEQLAFSEKPSQDERNRMIARLSEALSHGDLTLEELEDKVTMAHGASSREDLIAAGQGLSVPDVQMGGTAILGGVSVETRLPGESAGDARRRRPGEQRARRGGKKGKDE